MAIRIDYEGYGALSDAVASGATTSGARLLQENSPPQAPWVDNPWAGRQEYIASEAMRLAEVPREEIQKIRPPVPQQLFPPDIVDYDRTPLTIERAFGGDWSPKVRSWVSGSTQQIRRSDMQEDLWSGTMRGASSTVNPMM
jgi:hypothetical protein